MAACLANFSKTLSIPNLYSERNNNNNNKLLLSRNRGRVCVKSMKSSSSESSKRDNLDHLQKVSKHPQQQQQQRRWVSPSSPIGVWDRFPTARTINQMLETMERIMEEPYSSMRYNNGASSPSLSSQGINNEDMSYRRGRTPWEIKEEEGVYKMRFDMPGMTKNDVKLFVEENMLVIKAEKNVNSDDGDDGEWSARSFGKYNSRIALPEGVDVEKIKAQVKDGVLYVSIPKSLSSSKVLDIQVQ